MAEKNNINIGRGAHLVYLILIGLVFTLFVVVFLFFPRSRYSELEKRELAQFPDISKFRENPSAATSAISEWFSDSEPFRDKLMALSMTLRDAMRFSFSTSDEAVTFRPAVQPISDIIESDASEQPGGNPLADANAKIATAGIILAGNVPEVRALMAFGGSSKSGTAYASLLNDIAEIFPTQNVFALVASSAAEFYLPEKAKKNSNSEIPTLDNIRNSLSHKVRFVNVHDALAIHTHEDIFLRTDHHWAPLGAYYGASELARTAGVPFRGLDSYDSHIIHGFVGSMYGYSKDISVKNSPEDFIYHTPRGLDYTTTFITYTTDKNYQVISESKPYESSYFKTYKDGSGAAYSTFMGGDQNLVHIRTGSPGSRRLLIIKDSFGNALPGYLFYSFADIHVVDFRYFTKNLKQYVADNGITDIVVAFNIFNACNSGSVAKVRKILTQPEGIPIRKKSPKDEVSADSIHVQTTSVEETSAEVNDSIPT